MISPVSGRRRPGSTRPLRLAWVLSFALTTVPASAAPPPSVLVTTMTPTQGAVPDTVVAWGTVAQRARDTQVLTVQHEGQVQNLNVSVGETVPAGTPLLQVLASPATVAAYRQALTALEVAKAQRAHTAQLLAEHLATRDQLTQTEKAVADAQATLDALRREGGDQSVQTVTAPFDGVVTAISAAQGALIQANAPLLTLARRDRMALVAGLDPADLPKVQPGDPARLAPETGGGKALDGKVKQVGAMVDPKSRLVNTVIGIPPGSAVVGAAYRAVITVGQFTGWIVPRNAVLTDSKGAYVFQVADGKAVRVNVTMVGSHGDTTVVRGPIVASRKLVVQGNYQLSDGMAVRLDGAQS